MYLYEHIVQAGYEPVEFASFVNEKISKLAKSNIFKMTVRTLIIGAGKVLFKLSKSLDNNT